MLKFKSAAVVAALALSAVVLGADTSTTKPVRLVQPWSKLTTLSDDQKTKIRDLHEKANDDVRAIHDKEEADIMALLSDAQKAELKKVQGQRTTETKKKADMSKDEEK